MDTIIGREEELAALGEALIAARASKACQVITVRGEAGIGKSTLLTHFIAETRRAAPHVQVGYGQGLATCVDSEAYTALRECLRSLASAGRNDAGFLKRLGKGLAQSAPDWLPAVPLVGDLLAGGASLAMAVQSGSDARPSVAETADSPIHQLTCLVQTLAEEAPVVLVLDDLHWADKSTLDAITSIAMGVDGQVLLVLSYRTSDASLRASGTDGRNPLDAALFRIQRYLAPSGRYNELTVRSLEAADMRAVVSRELGVVHQGRDVEAIIARAGGNPLFATTLARLPGVARATAVDDDHSANAITAVLREQMSLVDDDHLSLMEQAALIGMIFEVDYLANLTRKDEDDVFDDIDEITRLGLFLNPYDPRGSHERYGFHHPLLCELLRRQSEDNGPRWRRLNSKLVSIYRAEADAVGGWDDDMLVRAVDAASHAQLREECHELSLLAARRQMQLGAVTQAAVLSRLAFSRADSDEQQLAAATVLIRALCAGGDDSGAVRAYEALPDLRLHPGTTAIACALYAARSLRMLAKWDALAAQLGEILAGRFGPITCEDKAQALMLQAESELCGPEQDTDSCLRTIEAVLKLTKDDVLVSRARGHWALLLLSLGDTVGAAVQFEGCLAAAERSAHPPAQFEALHWKSKFAMAVLDLDLAEDLLVRLNELSDRHGIARDSRPHSRDVSRVRGLQGRSAEAAKEFLGYWRQLPEEALLTATATLALQSAELLDLGGRDAARVFQEALWAEVSQSSAERDARLAGVVRILTHSLYYVDVRRLCLEELEVSDACFTQADAIFRFDVPDLFALRKDRHAIVA